MQDSNDIDKLIAQSQNQFGKKLIFFIILILAIGLAFLLWEFVFKSENESNFISYDEHSVEQGSIANLLIASGSTKIDKKMAISFATSGKLEKIYVQEGQIVKEGELLAELDSKELQNALDRQQIQLKKLLEYPSDQDIKSAEYLVSQAEKNLYDLMEYPSLEQLRSAEELLSLANANFISAQENYDILMVPTDAQFDSAEKLIKQAEQSLSNSNFSHDNSKDSVNKSKILLTEAVNNYCNSLNLPYRESVCTEMKSYPIAKSITDKILDKIFICCNANPTEMNLSEALINSNSDYISAIEQVNVYKKQVETAEASLKDSQNTLENLRNPSQNDIDRLTKLEEQAEKNLQKRIIALEDMQNGTDPEEIKLAEENLQKTIFSLTSLKKGSDKNDIDIQKLLILQAEENLSKTKIIAQFDGQVSSINFQEGEFVGSGQNILTLSDPSSMLMDIIASEAEYVEMKEGMYGLVSLDSNPTSPIIIQITSISNVPSVTQGIVTYPVKARFIKGFEVITVISEFTPLLQSLRGIDVANLPSFDRTGPPGGMVPGMGGFDINNIQRNEIQGMLSSLLSEELPAEGMNGTVTLLKESVQDVVIVPSGSLISDTSGSKVISSILGDKLEYIFVETGLSDGENTEIVSGLEESQLIYIKRVGNNASKTVEEIKTIDELTQGRPGGGPPGGGPPRGRP